MAPFREKLQSGVPHLGLGIMYPSPGVVERIGLDWDWIWIDGQHGEFGYNDATPICIVHRRNAKPAVFTNGSAGSNGNIHSTVAVHR